MRYWLRKWRRRPEGAHSQHEAAGHVPGDDTAAVDIHLRAVGAAQVTGAEAASVMPDIYREIQQTNLSLEVDDGVRVPVALDEQNASLVLEATQRMREYREREKAALPPVYNFGSEGNWGE